MTVFEPDLRRIIQPTDDEFTDFPFPAVAAIDTQIGTVDSSGNIEVVDDFLGSGIAITPVHFLTAGHVVYDDEAEDKKKANPIASRATVSAKQKNLNSRIIGDPKAPTDPGANVDGTSISFLANDFTVTDDDQDDIALLRTNLPIPMGTPVIGLIAFVDPKDAIGFNVRTAGYPVDNVSQPILDGNGKPGSGKVARDLVAAPGLKFPEGKVQTTKSPRLFFLNKDIDLESVQSGSGVWHSYENEDPRLLGLLNFDDPNVPDDGDELIELNGGVIFTTELYTEIIDKIKADIGTDTADDLPENLIIGRDSNNLSGNDDEIIGTYRKERILGLGGDDILIGAGADDRLEGGAGDDLLDGGRGDDLLDGGTNPFTINPFDRENDVAIFSANRSEYDIDTQTTGGILGIGGETVTTVTHLNGNGIDGTDTLTNIELLIFADGPIPLSSDDDVLDDLTNFFGGSGTDNIVGNVLANLLMGEGGNDRLEGDDGNDTLEGGGGNDSLFGGDDNDSLEGGAGNDSLLGNDGNDFLGGGTGFDTLKGGAGFDTLEGDRGNDLIEGGDQGDRILGGDGNDLISGGFQNISDGNDKIFGNNGSDTISGGNGNDTISGGNDDDKLWGQNGFDLMNGNNGNDDLRGEAGNDTLVGSSGDDTLRGGGGKDTLWGGDDRDLMKGNQDNDSLSGEAGFDTLIGSVGDDTLNGGGGNDRLWGQEDNDVLIGDSGRDLLEGREGDDTLNGGSGRDKFLFNINRTFNLDDIGFDVIEDFGNGSDLVALSKITFKELKSNKGRGFSRAREFAVVNNDNLADTSDAFIVYGATTGNLFYNQNGSSPGYGSGGMFATLEDSPTLVANSFEIR